MQANQAPNGGIGRPMKVGKEEYMGMLAAVEQWVKRDHVNEWEEWCVHRPAPNRHCRTSDLQGPDELPDHRHVRQLLAEDLHWCCWAGD